MRSCTASLLVRVVSSMQSIGFAYKILAVGILFSVILTVISRYVQPRPGLLEQTKISCQMFTIDNDIDKGE